MAHTVELDRSFIENIERLERAAQDQVAYIIKSLESDEYFEPQADDIIFQREKDICSCQHIRDWDEWQLTWFYKYRGSLVSKVIVLLIEKQPFLPLKPR